MAGERRRAVLPSALLGGIDFDKFLRTVSALLTAARSGVTIADATVANLIDRM